MRLLNVNQSSSQSPEAMFTSKYTWLLRWALRFSRNNRAAAEDLVQDTFLKLLLSWDSLWDLDHIEPLLYSHLKYAHLTEQRRSRQYSFQGLATINYETLAVRLSDANVDGLIEFQDELRHIVAFLLWRKGSTRFASVFLLRFFHGFFPDEIMLICRNSRHAIDLSMRYAREELRVHLDDPEKTKALHSMWPGETQARNSVLSRQDFVDDLRRWIFSAGGGNCLPPDELRRQYHSLPKTQIGTHLLAHIVSCESCLDEVSRITRVPPASTRSSGDSLGPAPRIGRAKTNGRGAEKEGPGSALVRAQRRLQEVCEQHRNKARPPSRKIIPDLWGRCGNCLRGWNVPVPVIAGFLAVVLIGGIWMGLGNYHSPPRPGEILERAISSGGELAKEGVKGAIHQRVEIRDTRRRLQRDLYRDIQGRRRRRLEKPDNEEQKLKTGLEDAGVNWDDPLSATDFLAWRGHTGSHHDLVTGDGNLLTLRTTSPDGAVEQESLTVRTTDFHPIMRTVEFRDQQVVEIAELAYEVVPWNATSNSWFEPEPRGNSLVAPVLPMLKLHAPAPLTNTEIYEAELNALLVLRELHADTERIELNANPNGIEVKGIVETDERKKQIVSQLRTIAHVKPLFLCYADLERRPGAGVETRSVAAMNVTSEASPLEQYFERKGLKREDYSLLSDGLLHSSDTIYRESKAIDGLLRRFSSVDLTTTARETLRVLLREHLDAVAAALDRQEQLLTHYTPVPASTSASPAQTALLQVAQHNFDLSKELLYPNSDASREATLILADLAASDREMRSRIVALQEIAPINNAVASSGVDTLQR